MLFFRHIHHSGAEAVETFGALEDVEIGAGFAAFPKFLVGGEFGECYGFVAEGGVDTHYGETCGESEYLGIGILVARKIETFAFDGCCETLSTEFGVDNKSRMRYERVVLPSGDVAKTCDFVACEGNYGVSLQDFFPDIFGSAVCET